MLSKETVPRWSLTRHVVLCDAADKVHQLTRVSEKKWLQLPCAPMPFREDTWQNVKVPATAVTALVGYQSCRSQKVLIPHLVRKDAPAVSHAYLQNKRLTHDAAHQEVRDLESVEWT